MPQAASLMPPEESLACSIGFIIFIIQGLSLRIQFYKVHELLTCLWLPAWFACFFLTWKVKVGLATMSHSRVIPACRGYKKAKDHK
eukprot:1158500-Pelagomonas_calceolata.AAC.9